MRCICYLVWWAKWTVWCDIFSGKISYLWLMFRNYKYSSTIKCIINEVVLASSFTVVENHPKMRRLCNNFQSLWVMKRVDNWRSSPKIVLKLNFVTKTVLLSTSFLITIQKFTNNRIGVQNLMVTPSKLRRFETLPNSDSRMFYFLQLKTSSEPSYY